MLLSKKTPSKSDEFMSDTLGSSKAERVRSFFLYVLMLSIPFSIAGDDFAIIGLYLVTIFLLITKKEEWISLKIQYGVIILFLGALVATIASAEPLSGFKYFRAFWRYGLPFLVFLALRKRQIHPYLRVLAIVSIIIAIYACIQSFTGMDFLRSENLQGSYRPYGKLWNAVGAFSHHLTYGGVSLVLFTLFAPAVFETTLKRSDRLLYAFGALCNLTGLVFTLGRSVWLGAIAAIVVMTLITLQKKSLIIILILVSIGFGAYSLVDPGVKKQFFQNSTIGKRIESITSMQANRDRLMMWQAAVNMIKGNPILGLGPENDSTKQPYYDKLSKEKNHRFQHPTSVGVHNIYLQTWVDFGLIGIIGYLFWWLVLLFAVIKAIKSKLPNVNGSNAWLTGLFGGFIGIMVAGVFENNFRDGEVQTVIFTAMGLAMALIHQKRCATQPPLVRR